MLFYIKQCVELNKIGESIFMKMYIVGVHSAALFFFNRFFISGNAESVMEFESVAGEAFLT